MKFRIVSVGKLREKFYCDGIQEYLKRLGAYTKIELIDGLEEKLPPRAAESEIKKVLLKEAERVLSLFEEDEIVVVCDIHGTMLDSEALAKCIGEWKQSGKSRVNLIIGSSHGLADIVTKRAAYSISLSRLTMPHQMAVLVLMEQVYRGFKILKGEPYHK